MKSTNKEIIEPCRQKKKKKRSYLKLSVLYTYKIDKKITKIQDIG